MSQGALYLGLGLVGGFVADKVFNDGEATDKVVSTVAGGSNTLKETILGGTDTIREVISEKIVTNTIEGVKDSLGDVKDNIEGGFSELKEKTSNVFDFGDIGLSSNLPKEESGYSKFKKNGGILGEASDIVGLGWLGSNIKSGWEGAIDLTQDFYSGAYNIGTIVKGSVTGQEYETKKVGDQYLRYPVEESGYKKKSSSSSSSRSSSKKKSSSSANFSSIDGTSKYVAPPKTSSSSGYKTTKKKELNYTPVKNDVRSFFSSIGVKY